MRAAGPAALTGKASGISRTLREKTHFMLTSDSSTALSGTMSSEARPAEAAAQDQPDAYETGSSAQDKEESLS